MFMAAAEAFGIDVQAIQKPGATLRDVFGAFVSHGAKAAEAANEKAAKLEAANRLLADENEALRRQAPASARSVLNGGASAASRAASLQDRTTMNGRQAMRAGLAKQANGRPNRPGAR